MSSPRIEIDCQQLMQLANQLRTGPQSLLGHIEQLIHDAAFSGHAFGIVASDPVKPGGSYDLARHSYEWGVHTAWGFLDGTSRGLAETAKTFASVEEANTLASTHLAGAFRTALGYAAQPHESDRSRFADISGAEIAVIAVAPMMEIWLYALGWIQACVDLCPILIEAIVLFGLIQPDDQEIQSVVHQWQLAANLVHSARVGTENTLATGVPAAWPSVPDSFGAWRQKVSIYLENLERCVAAVPGYISAAADRVNQSNQDLLYVLIGAFGALAVATALDVYFGFGETLKFAISASVLIAIQLGFLAVLGDLRGLFGAIPTVPPLELPHFGSFTKASPSDWTPMPKIPDMEDISKSATVTDING